MYRGLNKIQIPRDTYKVESLANGVFK